MTGRLKTIHELGERSYEKSRTGSLVEFALKEGVDIELVYKARRFYKTYPKPELERLCSLRRNGSGLPLHWSHVIYLIFADGRRRRSLAMKVAAEDLTASELLAEIKRRQGPRSRPGSGKPLKKYKERKQFLAVLSDAGRRWIRRAKQLTANTVVNLLVFGQQNANVRPGFIQMGNVGPISSPIEPKLGGGGVIVVRLMERIRTHSLRRTALDYSGNCVIS
jgi:hypothetical protein